MDGIQLAHGYTEIDDVPAEADKVIRWVGAAEELDGTRTLVKITNTDIYETTGSGFTRRTTTGTFTGNYVDATVVQNELIVVGVGGAAQEWISGANASATGSTNAPTSGMAFVASFADRTILARAAANTQLIEWSQSGDIEDFTGIGAGSVSLVDSAFGEDAIQGLETHGDNIVVYRRDSVWIGRRTGVPTPALQWQYRHGTGALAEKTIANAGALGDFYLGRDDVYLYHPRMGAPIRVGTPIVDTIFENINYAAIENCHGTFNKDTQEYWLFVNTGSNTFPVDAYILDVRRYRADEQLVWRKREFNAQGDSISASGAARTANFSNADEPRKMLFCTELGESFDSDSADNSDDGGTITGTYESPEFTLPDSYLQLSRMAIGYTATANSVINVATTVDGGVNWDNDKSYTLLAATGFRWATIWIRSAIGHAVQFRITTTDTNRPKLKSYRLGLMARGQIRRSS